MPAKKAPAKKQGAPEGYNEVKDRIVEFRAKHPDGCLRPADPAKPFEIVAVGGSFFLAYTAAAYRTPDDPCPGIGTAWEPVPGKTNFTRDSELQNAETSAWGRAIIAVGAADAHAGVASADEMRGRRQDAEAPTTTTKISATNVEAIRARCVELGVEVAEAVRLTTDGRTDDPAELLASEIPAMRDIVQGLHVNATPAEQEPELPTEPDSTPYEDKF